FWQVRTFHRRANASARSERLRFWNESARRKRKTSSENWPAGETRRARPAKQENRWNDWSAGIVRWAGLTFRPPRKLVRRKVSSDFLREPSSPGWEHHCRARKVSTLI